MLQPFPAHFGVTGLGIELIANLTFQDFKKLYVIKKYILLGYIRLIIFFQGLA